MINVRFIIFIDATWTAAALGRVLAAHNKGITRPYNILEQLKYE